METFKTVLGELEITPEVIVPAKITKPLDELQSDLKQAQDSRVYAYAQTIKPIDDTIIIMQKRVDEALLLGIKAKPIVVEEIISEEIIK